MRWRLRSVRTRILLLVLVPVLSLVGIYAFAVSITARDAVNLAKANTVKNAVGDPTGAFLAQLGIERMLAIEYMSATTGANLAKLELQEKKTDAATLALRSALTSSDATNNASPAEKRAIAVLLRDTASLPSLRAQVAAQIIPSSRAFTEYNAIVQNANGVLTAAIRQQNSALVVAQALAFVRMGQSEDLLSQENTLLVAAMSGQRFTPANLQTFTQLVGARRSFYRLTLPDLDPPYRAYYLRDVSPRALASLVSLEDTVVGTRPGTLPRISPVAWQRAVGAVSAGLSSAGTQAAGALTSTANGQASSTYLRLLLVGGLGLLAILISIALGLWIGRRQVRELSALRQTALELANERLPDVVTRLAAGEQVDVAAPALPATTSSSDEIGQVREAFAKVQQTAVEAAVGQARLRQGISHIFRNLARRSQSLLHRQLTLLDAMERRARDPQELDDLFRVDHLATRMRRHAESLIILSGEAPARGWRHPVPLVDVLRAAVAEVEDYTRIKVTATTQASLAGPAVGDVIHMIAELAENATIYSPPQTPVSITGSVVGQGFAVEIEDRGLGMSTAHRDEINAQLENPPAFDLSGSDQLGLFVAGQLAKRQNIRISLRSSPYGGTTAIVLIPRSLVVPEGASTRDTSPLPAGSSAQLMARHAIGSGHEPAWPNDRQPSLAGGAGDRPSSLTGTGGTASGLTAADRLASLTGIGGTPSGVTGAGDQPSSLTGTGGTPSGLTIPDNTSYRPPAADDTPYSPSVPSVPAATPSLRGEWGPALDWPEGKPAGPSENDDYRPLGYRDEEALTQSAGLSPLHTDPDRPGDPGGPGDGNGPGSVIPAAAEETARASLDDSGLPRRIRQASLAPQLRNSPARPAPSPADLEMLPEQSPSGQPSSEPPPDRSPEETRVTMSALQRGWERGRSVFDPAGSNGEGTPEPGAVAASPGDPDVIDATDAEHVVDAGATTTGDGAGAGAGQAAADTGITADSAAGRTDGGGASTGTHRTED